MDALLIGMVLQSFIATPGADPDGLEFLVIPACLDFLAEEVKCRLEAPSRPTLALYYLEGMAPTEISLRLGKPAKMVFRELAEGLEAMEERIHEMARGVSKRRKGMSGRPR